MLVNMEHVIGRERLLAAKQPAHAGGELGGAGRGADEVAVRVGGQPERGQGVVVGDDEHGNATAVVEPLGDLVYAVVAHAVGIEQQQVEVAARASGSREWRG